MTYHPKSDFIAVMMERGFLADCTDYQNLDEAALKGGMPGYIGFDATAKSLHVGSLIQIMMLPLQLAADEFVELVKLYILRLRLRV